MRRYSLGALAVMVFTSAPLFAGPITLTSSFVQGAVGDSGTPGIPSTTVCGDSTGAGSLSTTCSGSLAVSPSGTGFFSGTAAASASTLAALTLGSATSLDVWRVNDDYFGTFPRYVASATTTARMDDVVTVLGTGGESSGFLQLTFDLDGSLTESVDLFTLDGFAPTDVGEQFFANGAVRILANGVSGSASGPTTFSLNVPLLFGIPQPLFVSLQTIASADVQTSEGYRILADFLNTATLTQSTVLTNDNAVLHGASIASANGIDYEAGTSQPVPEPSTLTLMGIGAALIRACRRRTS